MEISSRLRVSYRWWILAVATLSILFSVGTVFYSLAPFLPVYSREFDDRAAVAGVTILLQIVQAASSLLMGALGQRFSPRLLMPVGVLLVAAALAALSFATAVWQLYLAYALMAVGASALSLVVIGPVLTAWFSERRGLAFGIATMAVSAAGVVFVPLDTWLIGSFGWRAAQLALAIGSAALLTPLTALVIRPQPGAGPRRAGEPTHLDRPPEESIPVRIAFRSGTFWLILVALTMLFFCQPTVILHLIAYLEDQGYSTAEAAAALTLATVTSASGRILLGLVADRLPKKWLAFGFLASQAAVIFVLAMFPRPSVIYPAMLAFGVTLAGFALLQPLILVEYFGPASLSALLGVTSFFVFAVSGLGPTTAGYLRQSTGSYQAPFLLLAGIELTSALLILMLRRPARVR